MDCAFCLRTEMARRIIAENELVFSFPTYAPVVEGHTLICPKRHVRYYEDLSQEERDALESMRTKIHDSLRKAFGAEGFNYAWNEEEVGGQSVPHFHLHILPRKKGDAGVHGYDPRQFLYAAIPKEKRIESTPEELERVSITIRKNLT